MLRLDPVGTLAKLVDEIMRELLHGLIASEGDRGQRFRSRDPPPQHLARHLQDRLRERVLEMQFVGARGVVDRKLTRMDQGLAAVLHDTTDAMLAERDQEKFLMRAGDPRRRAENVLALRGDLGTAGLAEL